VCDGRFKQNRRCTQWLRIGNVHAPETTGKFIAATFEHDTARPVDAMPRQYLTGPERKWAARYEFSDVVRIEGQDQKKEAR